MGISVRHRKMLCGGEFNPKSEIIWVNKDYRETLDGCYYLCHEFIHYRQLYYNEFPEFFAMSTPEPFSDKKLAIVLEAEYNAVNRAVKMLRTYGIRGYMPIELHPNTRQSCIEYWKNEYFKK